MNTSIPNIKISSKLLTDKIVHDLNKLSSFLLENKTNIKKGGKKKLSKTRKLNKKK